VQERIWSISAVDEDSSIRSRFHSWGIALRMWMANPIWGVGLRNYVVNAELFGATMGSLNFIHVAHNSYLQIAAEGGTVSILIYLALLFSVFWSASWLRRVARVRPDLAWAGQYARMFEAINVGFMVGSTFLNRGHFDLIYHFFSLVGCTVLIVRRHLAMHPVAVAAPVEVGEASPATGQLRVEPRSPVRDAMMPRWERLT
jgi:O-antigen ligase